ncbi:uncharacterized protein B0H18DRAFT_969276 [Fomitopsis serialis]|uniref:uncharacterized protein n=1 Tax=Fomitopsis serialis TaxID=139415 RepID=UPI002008DC9B|nr:uncharacterized protein B0H18DRAFT_969276 [Neoantrodia serialis]KAH9937140.1 hypothetical protein B0H18DRAFT_969276 [Neoantrodia serialis]
MQSDGEPHPTASTPSVASFAKSHSVRSSRAAPSTIRTVVTAPPWARDEPPSPTEDDPRQAASKENVQRPADSRPSASDVLSYQSSILDDPGPSRWWAFTRHRPTSPSQSTLLTGHPASPSRRPLREWERSLSIPWLSRSQQGSPAIPSANPPVTSHKQEQEQPDDTIPADPLHVDIPPPSTTPFTIAQNATPGWDSPWSARPLDFTTRSNRSGERVQQLTPVDEHDSEKERLSTWARRRKRLRAYMLYNPYVPLLFRFINIAFTTAALAIAIRIRHLEKRNGIMGAVGSSPTLVIIFASLTLVHVMVAIYTEYFGRPVGLWHTSSKLAYTLIEVVFICAWSAALALTFDNFFTSLIPCASLSSISWYNELPRATLPNLTYQLGIEGDHICDNQLALICLVGVGLIMYCFNLVISLFRVFERAKYHPASSLPT